MQDFYEMVTNKYYIDEKTIIDLYYQFITNQSIMYDFCKRIYDIVAALIILIVTLPITGYIAIRVKLSDGASPLFTQTRVGKDGKTFEAEVSKIKDKPVEKNIPNQEEAQNIN